MKTILFLFIYLSIAFSITACDDELILVQNSMSQYLSDAYYPPQVDLLWDRLKSIRATVDATYLLCLNDPGHVIVNPFTPNAANCLISLNKTAQLSTIYSKKQPAIIESDIKIINDIIYQNVADCDEIINFKIPENLNLSTKCKQRISDFESLLNNYTNAIIIGNDGKEFLADITISLEYQRRDCDFRTIAKPNIDKTDNCQVSNDYFGYVAEQIQSYLDKQDFNSYVKYFRFFYQTSVKATRLCQNHASFLNII